MVFRIAALRARFGPLAAKLLLSTATIAAVLGGLEGGARLLEGRHRTPTPPGPGREWDTATPGFYVMASRSPGWPPWQEFNRDGLRDRAHPLDKAPGTRRIVCLGDSVTTGPDGHPEQAYPQVLQAILSERGPGAEVFNVALWGWATRQERTAYERLVRRYHPDRVVLGVCLNDVLDLQNDLVRPPEWLIGLHHRSALVRRLVNAKGREIASVEEIFEAPDSARVRSGFRLLFDEIRELRRSVEVDGAQLTVAVFPYVGQVGPKAPESSAQAALGAFCVREGIAFLDLLPALRPLGDGAFLAGDGIHLSEAGCRRVAETVAGSSAIPGDVATISELESVLAPKGAHDAPAAEVAAALRHPWPEVRAQAAWVLGARGNSVPVLTREVALALADPVASVRLAAAAALGHLDLDDSVATRTLLATLADREQGVRWNAAAALSRRRLGFDDAPRLGQALKSEDYYVRAFAAWTLAAMGPVGHEALPDLVAARDDPDQGVRAIVVNALGQVGAGDASAVGALRQSLHGLDPDERWKAARALGRMGPSADTAVEDLTNCLQDPDERVRRAAAIALGRIGAVETSRTALARAAKDPDPGVARAAAEALAQLQAVEKGRDSNTSGR